MAEHPLHCFSSRYKPEDKRLFSYLYGTKKADDNRFLKTTEGTRKDQPPAISEIKLMDLINFYKSPVKWFYQKSLGLSFEEQEDHLEENERFGLNNLELWELKNELIKIDTEDKKLIEETREKYVKSGILPLRSFSTIAMSEILEDVLPVKHQKGLFVSGRKPGSLGTILKLGDDLSITGSVNEIYGNDLIAHSFSKDPLKYKVEAWIKYLFTRATGADLTVRFIYRDGSPETFGKISTRVEAADHLKNLAGHFKSGTTKMVLLTLRSAEKFKTSNEIEMAFETVQSEARFDKYRNPLPDKYLQKAIADGQFNDKTAFGKYLEELTPILINF